MLRLGFYLLFKQATLFCRPIKKNLCYIQVDQFKKKTFNYLLLFSFIKLKVASKSFETSFVSIQKIFSIYLITKLFKNITAEYIVCASSVT